MENEGLLDPDNTVHIFCLHYVFLPRINASIRAFRDAWNHHPMQSEGGRSPQQLWISGMAQFHGYITTLTVGNIGFNTTIKQLTIIIMYVIIL